eukprot:3932231-Rhodomonas_salina.1
MPRDVRYWSTGRAYGATQGLVLTETMLLCVGSCENTDVVASDDVAGGAIGYGPTRVLCAVRHQCNEDLGLARIGSTRCEIKSLTRALCTLCTRSAAALPLISRRLQCAVLIQAVLLRSCYAISGTDAAYAAALLLCDARNDLALHPSSVPAGDSHAMGTFLRICYAMSGTGIGSDTTPLLGAVRY